MAAHHTWYEEKKEFIQSLLSDKTILFAKVNGRGVAHWDERNNGFDIIVGYNKANDVFIICEAKPYDKNESTSFDCVLEYFTIKNKINVGYRKRSGNRVILVPNNKIDEFASNYNFYMYKYQNRK